MTRSALLVFSVFFALLGCTPGFVAIRLRPDSPEMRDALERAVAAWQDAGLAEGAVEIVDEGGAPAAFVGSLRGVCPTVAASWGEPRVEAQECAHARPDRSAAFLLLREDFRDRECRAVLAMHAIGHLLNPYDEHPEGAAVMALELPCDPTLALNDADAAFGCERAPCFSDD